MQYYVCWALEGTVYILHVHHSFYILVHYTYVYRIDAIHWLHNTNYTINITYHPFSFYDRIVVYIFIFVFVVVLCVFVSSHSHLVCLYSIYITSVQVPSYMSEFVMVTAWVQENGMHLYPNTDIGGKYTVLSNGELYINNASPSDAFKAYTCRTVNRLTGILLLHIYVVCSLHPLLFLPLSVTLFNRSFSGGRWTAWGEYSIHNTNNTLPVCGMFHTSMISMRWEMTSKLYYS